ncbi:MAG: hypothetical protein ACI35Q_02665 [Marinilabiliaceae bacterium]
MVGWVIKYVPVIITFLEYVKKFFEELKLDRSKENPFVINGDLFRKLLRQATVKRVGIFEAVYDEEFDEIFASRELQSENVDQQTKERLSQGDGMFIAD